MSSKQSNAVRAPDTFIRSPRTIPSAPPTKPSSEAKSKNTLSRGSVRACNRNDGRSSVGELEGSNAAGGGQKAAEMTRAIATPNGTRRLAARSRGKSRPEIIRAGCEFIALVERRERTYSSFLEDRSHSRSEATARYGSPPEGQVSSLAPFTHVATERTPGSIAQVLRGQCPQGQYAMVGPSDGIDSRGRQRPRLPERCRQPAAR